MLYAWVTRLGGPYDTDFYKVDPVITGEADECPRCGCCVSLLPWLPPYRAEITVRGKEFGDVVYDTSELLVSERFAEAFKKEGLKGLEEFKPVEIVRVKPRRMMEHVPTYWHTRIMRTGAAFDDAASGIVREEPVKCEYCGSSKAVTHAKVFTLKKGTWKGEVVFEARNVPGLEFATERFREFCLKYGITNVYLVEARDYRTDKWHDKWWGSEPHIGWVEGTGPDRAAKRGKGGK